MLKTKKERVFPFIFHAEKRTARMYNNLPDLMKMEDGTPVASMEERRKELLSLFAETMYGSIPTEGFSTAFETVEEGETLNGTAIRKQIKMTVTTEKGSSDALMLLILPKADRPVPVTFGLGFSSNHAVLNDPAILPSYASSKRLAQGASADAWCIEEAVKRGYGIAVGFGDDIMPDTPRTYGKRIISLFDKAALKGISAWAFGIERMIDYLVTDPQVDFRRLVLIGTSRLGKAALWAAANDERISLVIANVSGTCGAAMFRGNTKEQLADLNAKFPWWMNDPCKTYNARVYELPVDQHELIACIAPRKVYISSAEIDAFNDAKGTWNALLLSRDAFRLYGLEVIPDGKEPHAGGHVFTESMAYHKRVGKHGITPLDWMLYFDYMDQYLK